MRESVALLLSLGVAACSQQDAPAEEIAQVAEEIVDRGPDEEVRLADGRFAPRDECVDLEGATAFRSQIAATVEARDAASLVALAADDIQLDFGGGSGREQLAARLEEPSGALWDDLGRLLELGCAANGQGGMTLPWIFEQDVGVADPGSAMVVMGEDVPLREAPGADGPIVRTISWDVVEVLGFQPEAAFQKVAVAPDATGYLPTDRLRSLLDYRLVASSRNGRWRITSLIAGD